MRIITQNSSMILNLRKVVTALDRSDLSYLREVVKSFNINSRIEGEDNDTLLMHSLAFSSEKVYNFLIENGASIWLKNDLDETVIHSIVYSGDPNRLSDIYRRYRCDLDAQSDDGTTPLILAAGLEKWEVFERLIDLGANINLTDHGGNAPIHLCCSLGNIEAVRRLVDKGARLFEKTKKGNLPLALAVNENHVEVVQYLFYKMYG